MKHFTALFFIFININISAQINVKLKDTLFFEETYIAETKQIINSKSEITYNNVYLKYFFIIENINADTSLSIILQFTNIKLNASSGQNKYTVDTGTPLRDDTTEAFLFYTELLKKKFVYKISATRTPLEYKRNYEVLNAAADSANIPQFRQKSYFSMYNNANVVPKYKLTAIAYKNNNAADTVNYDIYKLCNFNINNIKSDTCNMSAKVLTDKNKPNIINGVYILYDLEGNWNAKISCNKYNNIISNWSSSLSASGNVAVKYSKNALPAYIWPMSVNVKNSFKLIKINSKFVQ